MQPKPVNWILCGHVPDTSPPCANHKRLQLRISGPDQNVFVEYAKIKDLYWGNVKHRILDVIAIAAYVYSADQAIRRRASATEGYGDGWRRQLYFRVEVRDIAFWQMPQVHYALTSLLSFLTDDMYSFEFIPWHPREYADQIMELDFDQCPLSDVDEVMLFSGGLDSLAGAIHLAKKEKCRAVWVKHESNPKYHAQHQQLAQLLNQQLGSVMGQYVPVRVNKDSDLTVEPIQRSRSFLFGTLAMAIASFMNKKRILFFENGVVSLNLPLSTHVLGARATRTTHPRTLAGLSTLFSLVLDQSFDVVNPFIDYTKTDIVKLIVEQGFGSIISKTISCAHPRQAKKETPHCGVCSQCIDRRFAMLAANATEYDPVSGYGVELIRGGRPRITDQTMLACYVETAMQFSQMTESQFLGQYGEAARAIRYGIGTYAQNVRQLFQLHQRHGQQIAKVVKDVPSHYSHAVYYHSYEPTSLLGMIIKQDEIQPISTLGTTDTLLAGPNMFQRQGEMWRIQFRNSEPFYLIHTLGLEYLRCLLSTPRTRLTTSQLILNVMKDPRLIPLSDARDEVDQERFEMLHVRVLEVVNEITMAKSNHDEATLLLLERERELLQSELEELQRVRKWGSVKIDNRRAYNRVAKAVDTVITKIEQYNRPLYEHLTGSDLQRGQTWYYTAPEGVSWIT